MKFLRGLAAALVLAGASVGISPPAQAAGVMQGVYTFTSESQNGLWTIYPICVPVVGDLREPLYLPVGCTLHVGPSEGLGGGDARLAGNQWTFTQPKAEGLQCADGSFEPTVEVFKFDDTTMSGTRSISHSGACGTAPAIITTPFTLAFKEPLPIGVQQYPLYCEPGGLRRCF